MAKNNQHVWFDEITGMHLTKDNGPEVAKFVGGKYENGVVFVKAPRGELAVRVGDFVGKDQNGVWHITRLIPTES